MSIDPTHRYTQDELARMVEQERRELQNAPVVAVVVGPVLRCHHCGEATDQLYKMTGPDHPNGVNENTNRLLCRNCHPEARKAYWKHLGRYDAASDAKPDTPEEH